MQKHKKNFEKGEQIKIVGNRASPRDYGEEKAFNRRAAKKIRETAFPPRTLRIFFAPFAVKGF
jgi:hypothetical protein